MRRPLLAAALVAAAAAERSAAVFAAAARARRGRVPRVPSMDDIPSDHTPPFAMDEDGGDGEGEDVFGWNNREPSRHGGWDAGDDEGPTLMGGWGGANVALDARPAHDAYTTDWSTIVRQRRPPSDGRTPESALTVDTEDEEDALGGIDYDPPTMDSPLPHDSQLQQEPEKSKTGVNTCYLAAALRVIFRTPDLRECVTRPANLAKPSDPDQQLLVETLAEARETLGQQNSLLAHLAVMEVTRGRLIDAGLIPEASRVAQEDAADMIMKILDRFDPKKVPGMSTPITQSFTGTCLDVRDAHHMASRGLRSGPVFEYALSRLTAGNVSLGSRGIPYIGFGQGSAGELASALETWELIEAESGDCRLLRQAWRIDAEDTLMLNIGRHYIEDGMYKTSEVAISSDNGGSIELPVHEEDGPPQKHLFRFHACTVYSGSGLSGHWVAMTRQAPGAGGRGREWRVFDDSLSIDLSEADAVARCSSMGTFVVLESLGLAEEDEASSTESSAGASSVGAVQSSGNSQASQLSPRGMEYLVEADGAPATIWGAAPAAPQRVPESVELRNGAAHRPERIRPEAGHNLYQALMSASSEAESSPPQSPAVHAELVPPEEVQALALEEAEVLEIDDAPPDGAASASAAHMARSPSNE